MAIISMDRMGNVRFLDDYENEITDYYEIQDVKKYTNWKEIVYNQSVELIEEVNRNINEARNFYLKTEKLISEDEIRVKLAEIKLEEYKIPKYTRADEGVLKIKAQAVATVEAEKNCSGFLPWKVKEQRKAYVDLHFPEILEKLKQEEEENERQFYEEAEKRKQRMDADYKRIYDEKVGELEKFITGDEKKINSELKILYGKVDEQGDREALKNCLLIGDEVVGLFIIYEEYKNNFVKALVRLPYVTKIENRNAKMLASNKVSVKFRKNDEILTDWHWCCCGMLLYVASKIFNVNTNIKEIEIYSNCSVTDEATGEETSQIYDNTFFTREDFEKLNISAINPVKTIERFHKDFENKEEATDADYSEEIPSPELDKQENILFNENSVNIITSCLSQIAEQFNIEIFYTENIKKFVSVCKDLCLNNYEEIEFLKKLCEEGILEKFARKDVDKVSCIQFVAMIQGNHYVDENSSSLLLEKLILLFQIPTSQLKG